MNGNQQPYDQAFFQAVPTNTVLRWRQNLAYQAWRFMVVNVKMIQVVRRSHRQ